MILFQSPELLKRLETLKAKLEEKQYRDMVKNVSQSVKDASFISLLSEDMKVFKKQHVN